MPANIHRKANPLSKLKMLTAEEQARIFTVSESSTLKKTMEWLREEMQISIGKSALSDWAAWYRRREWIKDTESDATDVEAMLKHSSIQSTPEALAAISNAVFLSRVSKIGDAKVFTQVASIIQRSQRLISDQKMHEEKMEIAHKKLDLHAKGLKQKLKELQMKIADYQRKEREIKSDLANTALNDVQRIVRLRARFGERRTGLSSNKRKGSSC